MSDAPETDAKWQELCCSKLSWYHIADNIKTHSRKLERERDEAILLLKLCAEYALTTHQDQVEEFLKKIK